MPTKRKYYVHWFKVIFYVCKSVANSLDCECIVDQSKQLSPKQRYMEFYGLRDFLWMGIMLKKLHGITGF